MPFVVWVKTCSDKEWRIRCDVVWAEDFRTAYRTAKKRHGKDLVETRPLYICDMARGIA